MSENFATRKGDPILSSDCKRVVGYWKRGMTWEGDVLSITVAPDIASVPRDIDDALFHGHVVQIRAIIKADALTVCAVVGGEDLAKWLPDLVSPYHEPGPTDVGIVAACDVLLSLGELTFGNELGRLREFYAWKAGIS